MDRVDPAGRQPTPPRIEPAVLDLTEEADEKPEGAVSASQVQAELRMFTQPRRKVAHEIGPPEKTNDIAHWRTSCGWAFG